MCLDLIIKHFLMISNKVNRFIALKETSLLKWQIIAPTQMVVSRMKNPMIKRPGLFIDLNVLLLTTLAASRSLKVGVNYIGML